MLHKVKHVQLFSCINMQQDDSNLLHCNKVACLNGALYNFIIAFQLQVLTLLLFM